MGQCSARSARTGLRCKMAAIENLDVCAYHRTQNGKTLPIPFHGPEEVNALENPKSPRTGRYARILPERMHQTIEEAARDPELLSNAAEIQLLDARIADVMVRAEAGESGALWKALKDCYQAMQDARRAHDPEQVALRLNDLGRLIERGFADYAVWSEITSLMEMRRKLSEAEQKRLVQLKLVLTADEAEVYATRILQAVQKHVPDPDTRARIALDIRAASGHYRGIALPAEALGTVP